MEGKGSPRPKKKMFLVEDDEDEEESPPPKIRFGRRDSVSMRLKDSKPKDKGHELEPKKEEGKADKGAVIGGDNQEFKLGDKKGEKEDKKEEEKKVRRQSIKVPESLEGQKVDKGHSHEDKGMAPTKKRDRTEEKRLNRSGMDEGEAKKDKEGDKSPESPRRSDPAPARKLDKGEAKKDNGCHKVPEPLIKKQPDSGSDKKPGKPGEDKGTPEEDPSHIMKGPGRKPSAPVVVPMKKQEIATEKKPDRDTAADRGRERRDSHMRSESVIDIIDQIVDTPPSKRKRSESRASIKTSPHEQSTEREMTAQTHISRTSQITTVSPASPPAPKKGSPLASVALYFNMNYYRSVSGSLILLEILESGTIVVALSNRHCYWDAYMLLFSLAVTYFTMGCIFFINGLTSGDRADLATGVVVEELPFPVASLYYCAGYLLFLLVGIAALVESHGDIYAAISGTTAIIEAMTFLAHVIYTVRH